MRNFEEESDDDIAGSGPGTHRDRHDRARHQERRMGHSAELSPRHFVDEGARSDMRRGHRARKYAFELPDLADELSGQGIPGVHTAKRYQDDERTAEGAEEQSIAELPERSYLGSQVFPRVYEDGGMEEVALLSLLLPRGRAGETEFWSARLEYTLRV